MPTHKERKFLPYTERQLFTLVSGIEDYPDFLPWCTGARVRTREPGTNDLGHDCEFVTADLIVRFKVFRETFGSRVMLDPKHHRIVIEYLDGPFKHLETTWTFEAEETGATVNFFIDFEFKSSALQVLIGTVFEHALERMMSAFETRAEELYGK